MQPDLVRKFKTLALICFFTSFAGVIYQLIDDDRLDYSSVLFGFPLGWPLDYWNYFFSQRPKSCFVGGRLQKSSYSKPYCIPPLFTLSALP